MSPWFMFDASISIVDMLIYNWFTDVENVKKTMIVCRLIKSWFFIESTSTDVEFQPNFPETSNI